MGKYPLLGQKITFKDCYENLFDLQYQMWQSQNAASSEFDKWYDSCKDILTVLKGFEDTVIKIVSKHSCDKLFATLPSLELYDISQSSYIEDCLIFDNSVSAFDEVVDAYNNIIAQQAAEEEYRAERKATRARVVGGGFGVGGAIKGMAAAGAMNAVSGAGHSLVNAIGNMSSAAEAASAKRALYKDRGAKEFLRDGVVNDIQASYNAHIQLVNQRKGDYYLNPFDADKAGALFENAKKVPEKRAALLIEACTYCPWNTEVLTYIYTEYAEERKNVWTIAKRFHVNLSNVAENCFAKMYAQTSQTEESAQAIKKEILAQMNDLGITRSGTIDRIERDGVARLLNGYEKASEENRKTMFSQVDAYDATELNKGVVIREKGVWELAKKYRVEFSSEEVEKILSVVYTDTAKKSEDAAQKAKAQIKIIMKALDVKESTTFDTLEKDCIQRLCPNYATADEATCNTMLETIAAYDALDKNKSKFVHGIHARIEAIWSAEDGEVFDNVYLNTNIHNSQEILEAIKFIDGKKRTSSASKYLCALYACSEENIKKAQQFQQPSTTYVKYAAYGAIALSVALLLFGAGWLWALLTAAIGAALLVYYNKLKKNWNILTLNGTLVHAMISINGVAQQLSVAKDATTANQEIEIKAEKMVELEKHIQELQQEKQG